MSGKSVDCVNLTNKQLVQLLDGETNKLYSIYLSPEDAKRARIDLHFAQSLLNGLIREENKNDNNKDIIEPEAGNAETAQIWTHEQTLLLISAYHQQQDKMKSGKLLLRTMWKNISEQMEKEGYKVPSNKCAIKFDTLKRRYKKVIDHNNQSGNDPMSFKYFNEFDAMFRKQPWIEPEVVASSELQDLTFENMNERHSEIEDASSNAQLSKKGRKAKFTAHILEEKRLRRQSREAYRERKLMLLEKLVDHITGCAR